MESNRMNDDDAEKCIKYVEKWMCQIHNFHGKITALDVQIRGKFIDVALLSPYGLFIIHPDGKVEDNYKTFSK